MIDLANEPRHFGIRLRQARSRAGLSQLDMAARLGLSSHYIPSRWECGRKYPTFWQLVALAQILNVEAGWLIGTVVASTELLTE